MTFLRAVILALLFPGAGLAHPHIYIDGGAGFVFDAEGRLTALRITWIYDEFYSLSLLLDYGLDPDGDGKLEEQERIYLADSQTAHWIAEYQGDGYLLRDGADQALGRPGKALADVVGGRITITFERALQAPYRPGRDTVFKAYDPTYYVAYAITEESVLEAGAGCAAQVVPFSPDAVASDELAALALLGPYETPEGGNVGEAFADRIELQCD